MKRGQPSISKSVKAWLLLPILFLIPAMVSCGGGGSVSVAGGGIGGTGYTSVGAITAKGSIFVNGIEFETSDSAVTMNGVAGDENDLKVGMVVKVEGTVNTDGVTGKADVVEFNHNAYGPISSIDPDEGILDVMGQTVLVDEETIIADQWGVVLGKGIDGLGHLAVDDMVEISGMTDADGNIRATRITRKQPATGEDFEIRGVIGYVDTTNKFFGINYQWVDYSDAALVNFAPAGGPVYWDYVVVKGSLTTGTIPGTYPPVTASILKASRVEKVVPYYDPDYIHQFFGYVGEIYYENESVSGFQIWTMFGPMEVQLQDETVISGRPLEDIETHPPVMVQGTIQNNIIQATKLDIKELQKYR